jgi:hypothetical protein
MTVRLGQGRTSMWPFSKTFTTSAVTRVGAPREQTMGIVVEMRRWRERRHELSEDPEGKLG